ncbi:MAG: hypothetical protein LLG01_17955 [Planctomycetaceae bacterium]|nr:hypothetical protein [Planctomycetaceae bacterium]
MTHRTSTRWVLAANVVLALGAAAWAAPPSTYNKNDAVFKAGKLAATTDKFVGQYNNFKEQGTLEKKSDSTVRVVDLAESMSGQLWNVIEAYLQAVRDGWPESDPQLLEVKAKIEAARTQMEACGMWMSFAFGETAIPEGRRLDYIRGRAWYAAILVKNGEVDKGSEMFKEVDGEIARLHKKVADAVDQGETRKVTVKLKEAPAYLRTMAEVDRFKKEAAPGLAKVSAGREGVDKDAKTILEHQKKFEDVFRQVESLMGYGQMDERIKRYEQFLPKLKGFEADAAAVKAFLKEFSGKYGANSMDIDNTMAKLLNAPLNYERDPGNAYRDLDEGLKKMDDVRPAVAKVLLEEIQNAIKNFRQYNEKMQDDFFALQKQRLTLAADYDAANATVADMLKNIDATKKSIIEKINKEIDAEVWDPKHSGKFQGPGDANSLCSSAEKWFKSSEWMNQYSLVAIRIAGDWHAAEKNALGMQINWGLPVEVALYSHEDRKAGRDVVKSFWLSMYTHDLKQGPPWKIAAVGDNRWMRTGAFKGAALTDVAVRVGGSAGGMSGSKSPFLLFRLVLSLTLICLGILAATPLITKYVPVAAATLAKFAGLKTPLAVIALAAGAVTLLWNLVLLRPQADLLPQAIAIITGLVFGAELLVRKRLAAVPATAVPVPADGAAPTVAAQSGASQAVHKAAETATHVAAAAQDLLIRHQGQIKALEKYQVPMGVACVVLGLLHLIFAGAALL